MLRRRVPGMTSEAEHHAGASLAALHRRTGLDSPTLMAMLTCQGTNPMLAGHSPEC